MIKQPIMRGKILGFKRIGDCIVKYYKVTTWFNDGTSEESEEPAWDQPIVIPATRIY